MASSHDLPVGGRFEGTQHRFPVRVYFEDTDLSGVVYHANYLRYMERARSDMLRLAGIDQRGFHDAGEGAYAVSEIAIKYRRPAKLDDALVVVTELTAIRAASVDIHQRVMRGDEIVSDADVTAALVAASGRPRRQPREWIEAFERLLVPGTSK
ncbi:tol-pal system-associated acyl-CoA thioesterase [Sphingomonas sp. PB4P5]|uniref:tol-pal system-associated acyl-CoA thioesterase n=1 Tax=Parasphingomonas puruogangriensis TaxID=3096155 RepID=UPI002FCB7DBB